MKDEKSGLTTHFFIVLFWLKEGDKGLQCSGKQKTEMSYIEPKGSR